MFKNPVGRFCYVEVVSHETKLPRASDQGDVGLLVVISHMMFVERSSVLTVLDTVPTSQGENLSEERISCSTDFPFALEGRTRLSSSWAQSRKCGDLISIRTRTCSEEI